MISLQHVMYLRELRLAQMERLMVEFLHGVDIYLSLVRDSKETNPKVREISASPHTGFLITVIKLNGGNYRRILLHG